MGCMPVWYNPDATLEDLKKETDESSLKNGLYYQLSQWQEYKEGRKTGCKEVEVKRYALK